MINIFKISFLKEEKNAESECRVGRLVLERCAVFS